MNLNSSSLIARNFSGPSILQILLDLKFYDPWAILSCCSLPAYHKEWILDNNSQFFTVISRQCWSSLYIAQYIQHFILIWNYYHYRRRTSLRKYSRCILFSHYIKNKYQLTTYREKIRGGLCEILMASWREYLFPCLKCVFKISGDD